MADPIYLSRIHLPARSRGTQRLLADCHAMHRFVMSGFPQSSTAEARAELGVLFRVESTAGGQAIAVLVQSVAAPTWVFEDPAVRVEGPRELDSFLGAVANGRRYRFRLQANPTRRVAARATRETDPEHGREWFEKEHSVGRRVAIRGDEQRMAWLERKAADSGFKLVAGEVRGGLDAESETHRDFIRTRVDLGQPLRDRAARLTFETCVFEGLLEVTDAARLVGAVKDGIGSGKAFGNGLLSLAPVQSP